MNSSIPSKTSISQQNESYGQNGSNGDMLNHVTMGGPDLPQNIVNVSEDGGSGADDMYIDNLENTKSPDTNTTTETTNEDPGNV